MSKYSAIKVVKDGTVYVVQRRFDGIWMNCGWYVDKAKAVLAAQSLAYCYDCHILSITKR